MASSQAFSATMKIPPSLPTNSPMIFRHLSSPRPQMLRSLVRFVRMVSLEIDNSIVDANSRIPGEAKKILHSLASNWGEVIDYKALQVVPLKGAMTNEVYLIKWPTKRGVLPPKVLVRIYGEGVDVLFDRAHEIRVFESMSKHGMGPRLLGQFPNGRIEEFINAHTLLAADLQNPKISALIASKLRELHDLKMPGPKKVKLWDRLRKWLNAAKSLCSIQEAREFCLDSIWEEMATLEHQLVYKNQKIGFCHNDLQYGNIMIDEEHESIAIIDYEYASYNPIAYDLANHFCEMAADYHTATPQILDFSKYPDFEQQKRFVCSYLSSSGNEPSNLEVEQLIQDIEKYTLASHLHWGLWGIISEHVNGINFDYREYARQRFQQYWHRKTALLGSGAP